MIALCPAPSPRGGTWTDDDSIIFSPSPSGGTTLLRVSASGGTPAVFSPLSTGAVSQRWPQALPGARGVLFSESASAARWDAANLVVVPLSGGTPKVVVRSAYYGRYVPGVRSEGGLGRRILGAVGLASPKQSEGGHLVYMNQDTLFAVRFDLDRLEAVGQAVPALEGIAGSINSGGVQMAVSSDGTLVYVPGTTAMSARSIDWLTRDGEAAPLRTAEADWANPRFSPDGQALAMDISDGRQRDIWVYAWERGRLTQLTFDPGNDTVPVWTPDGRRIVFASDRAKIGVSNLYWVNADGTGEVTRLTDSPYTQTPGSWDLNSRFLAFTGNLATGTAVMILPMEGDGARGSTPGTPTVFLDRKWSQGTPAFSPDGRWIAYHSNEASGAIYDVYVRPFRGPGGPWRISTTGGRSPRWSTKTHELLYATYLNPTTPSKIMTVPYTVAGETFQVEETPQVWSPTSVQAMSPLNAAYDLHPDGKRIAASPVRDESQVVQDHVVFVFNFAEYLATIAPAKE